MHVGRKWLTVLCSLRSIIIIINLLQFDHGYICEAGDHLHCSQRWQETWWLQKQLAKTFWFPFSVSDYCDQFIKATVDTKIVHTAMTQLLNPISCKLQNAAARILYWVSNSIQRMTLNDAINRLMHMQLITFISNILVAMAAACSCTGLGPIYKCTCMRSYICIRTSNYLRTYLRMHEGIWWRAIHDHLANVVWLLCCA